MPPFRTVMSVKQEIMDHINKRYGSIYERYADVQGFTKAELANKLDTLRDLYFWIKENINETENP